MSGWIALLAVAILFILMALFWLYAERWHPLRPSTWAVMRKTGWRGVLNLSAVHAYAYGRWTKQYLDLLTNQVFPRLSAAGRKRWADRYHGKVLTHDQARAIVTLNREIPRRDLEQIIPYAMARDLVLKGPPEVAVFPCACRQRRVNPCLPIQVCMVIGQPFVDFILEHHPKTSRRLSQTEAVELLEDEHRRGHLHSAWFKDVLLGRFYAICNCCKCCCGGIEAMRKHGVPMVASFGYVAHIDETACTVCGICEEKCPFDAIRMEGTAAVTWEACMGCGVCVSQCPGQAISLVRDEDKGMPLDVRLLDS
jgi:ferredoxin